MVATINPYYFSIRKRLFDVLVSAIGTLVLMPMFLIIAFVIKRSSSGPVFFIQRRAGLKSRPFKMYKFRTMYVGADKDQIKFRRFNTSPPPTFKIKDDPRFVGVGKWISKKGIDEIPQLLNVLVGDMSLVGPRPLPVKEEKQLPSYWRFRTQVKPGIFSSWIIQDHENLTAKKWAKSDMTDLRLGSTMYDTKLITTVILKLLK